MLTTVFTKTIRDRWLGWTIAVVCLMLLTLYGMAVYRQIDLSILTSMPEAYVALIGIREDVDAGGLAVGAIQGLYGAITLAAMALAMGAASVAGEERDGTMGILLGNPKGRTHVLVSKAAAMVLLAAVSVLILWGAVYAIAAMLGVEIGGLDVEALSLHMFVNVLFYGLLAIGRQRLDRQSGGGRRCNDRGAGPVVLCRRPAATHRGTERPSQGVPVVLLRRQRSGLQRRQLGPSRRAGGWCRGVCRHRRDRCQSSRPEGAIRRRHPDRPPPRQSADQEGHRPTGRLGPRLLDLAQGGLGISRAAASHGGGDVLDDGPDDGAFLQSHP